MQYQPLRQGIVMAARQGCLRQGMEWLRLAASRERLYAADDRALASHGTPGRRLRCGRQGRSTNAGAAHKKILEKKSP